MTVFYCALSVKSFLQETPVVDELRPAHCPCCGVASRPVGGPLRLHGHGLRARQVIWLQGPDAAPRRVVIWLRRFRCTACGAVITVLPRDLVRYRRFCLQAICLALALWSHGGLSAEMVRDKLGFHETFEAGWPQLRRWATAAEFAALGLVDGPPRKLASQIATRVAGRAPPSKIHLPIAEMTLFGAAYLMC